MAKVIPSSLPTSILASMPTKLKSRSAKNAHGLTVNQQAFVQAVAENPGMTITDAYIMAYPNFKGARPTMACAASRLYSKDIIQERVKALRAAIVARCPMSMGEVTNILAGIIRDTEEPTKQRIAAIRQLHEMHPEWTATPDEKPPERIEVVIVTEQRSRPTRQLMDSMDSPGGMIIDV